MIAVVDNRTYRIMLQNNTEHYCSFFTFFLVSADHAGMDRFFGFASAQTWLAYDSLARHGREVSQQMIHETKDLPNAQAIHQTRMKMLNMLHDVTRHAEGREPAAMIHLVRGIIDDANHNTAHGELLVALRWNLYGQPVRTPKQMSRSGM